MGHPIQGLAHGLGQGLAGGGGKERVLGGVEDGGDLPQVEGSGFALEGVDGPAQFGDDVRIRL